MGLPLGKDFKFVGDGGFEGDAGDGVVLGFLEDEGDGVDHADRVEGDER